MVPVPLIARDLLRLRCPGRLKAANRGHPTVLLLATGYSWQIQSTTFFGGLGLLIYLMVIIGSMAYRPEVAVGVYLLIGGALLFGSGILLSVYRDRLLKLPEQISRREGIFRIIGWR